MTSLIILTLTIVVLIILFSLLVKRLEVKLFFPIAFVFISICLFIISFTVGKWEGMGLGAVSVSLFVASSIALIGIVVLQQVSFKE
ncbi:YesK family protein [Virgibacillus flavescens]|uniref:YesK family protein n=1 Tax=Virgibacillus flavescens TaxID=1611422 RepID=UPI003D350B40